MALSVIKQGLSIFGDVDNTPVDGATKKGISSNWAYDHAINYGLHKKMVRKTADETVNNSTTLQNDDELLLAVGANEVWVFEVTLLHNSGATPDLKVTFAVPSGATGRFARTDQDSSAATWGQTSAITGHGGNAISKLYGIVINSTTAGNLTFQWAQNTQDASDTKVLTNSCLIATQLV